MSALTSLLTLQGGKYQIIRMLGQGGFGITYEAEQVTLHRRVAIKEFFMKDFCNRDSMTNSVTLGTSEGSKDQVERFRKKFIREAQMIAGLNNPHIIKVYDVFEENGTAYYVMDYISGGSLVNKVQHEGPLKKEQALLYIHQIADALDYLHSRNFLHFDVKPSNILLNDKNEAVLIDFGISKHYDEAGLQTTSTPIGISPGYAPLEQYRQTEISSFTPSTDIYSLGATLYYLITGQAPPDASHVNEDGLPPMPSSIDISLQKAITKAMSPRRRDRPQDIASFLALFNGKQSVSEETNPVGIPRHKQTPTTPSSLSTPSSVPKSQLGANKQKVVSTRNGKKSLWLVFVGLAIIASLVFLVSKEVGESNKLNLSTSGQTAGHDWVDLGLSVKWATCNLGASSPTENGDFFAWGETVPKSSYKWENYRYRTNGNDFDDLVFSKYIDNYFSGEPNDNKTCLELTDDAAHTCWGGKWRMPTAKEMEELKDFCEWTRVKLGGKREGYKVTSRINGNCIFLPSAGRNPEELVTFSSEGYYWTSSLSSTERKQENGLALYKSIWADVLNADSYSVSVKASTRFHGCSIRPVIE